MSTRFLSVAAMTFGLAACEATMPPPPPAQPAPPPSGKAQLDDADVEHGLASIRVALDACVDQYKAAGRPEAILVIAPTGEVKSADVYRCLNISERRCLERDLRVARFPAFTGAEMKIVVTLGHADVDGGADALPRG